MNHIGLEGFISKEDSLALLDLIKSWSDSIMLHRRVDFSLDNEVEKAVRDKYFVYVQEMDADLRLGFATDEAYRADLLDIYGSEEEVYEYFDALLASNMSIIDEEEEEEEEIDTEETFEDFDLTDVIDSEVWDTEDAVLYSEDVPEYFYDPVEYDEENFKQGPYEAEDIPVEEVIYTRVTATTIGPVQECIRYSLENVYLEITAQLNSLYTFPLVIDGYLVEDPVFTCNGEKVAFICSHETFAVLKLNDHQYESFKKLNIRHSVEGESREYG